MPYKLVALDIDGTLLNDDHQLVEENKAVIQALLVKGVQFVLVTGRPDVMALKYAKELGMKPVILGYNGATIRDLDSKIVYDSSFIHHDQVYQICKHLNLHQAYYRLYCMDSVYSFNEWEFDDQKNRYAKFSRHLKEVMDFRILKDLNELEEAVVKVVVFSEIFDELEELKKEINQIEGLSIVFGSKNGLDINAKNVNKGQALIRYASELNIKPEEIIAIGDSENDLSMLSVVGMPITLENGSRVLKEMAQFIACSNNDGGVAHGLKHCFHLNKN